MKIYKYKLGTTVNIPINSRILHCNTQEGALHVWALVDPDQEKMDTYEVAVIGTGHSFNPAGWDYITTVHENVYVWHIWFKKIIDEWEFS